MLRKITCNRTRKLIAIKEKVSLYFSEITFSYNQWLHLGISQYNSSLIKNKRWKEFVRKKKKRGKENEMEISGRKEEKKKEGEGKERGGKEEKKKKWMERVCAEGKGKGRIRCGKKDEKEGEGEEKEEEKEKQKMEKATQEKHRLLRTHSLARS